MAVSFSPWGNQQFSASGIALANGHKIYTYAAGSSTPLATYTDSTGVTPQSNPIILNSLGLPTNGQIWLTSGLSYKLVWTDATGVVIKEEDNITGVASAASVSQWQASGLTPTYISTTSFTLAGDQTSAFHAGRRLQFTVTAGTVYGSIASSAYGALTTVTMTMDAGQVLDSGLSAVNYGILTATNPSVPSTYAKSGANSDITSLTALTSINILPGYLFGCTLSTAGSSATMSISAGRATDSTGLQSMALAAIAKTTSAWAAGSAQGGLDTGAIANSTWYHFYVIRRPDTGVVDVLFSLSATAPTLPTNYTQFRRIGSGLTNGSAQWTLFKQFGDWFDWDTPVKDVEASAPGTAAVTRTLSVPTGVAVVARVNAGVNNSAAAVAPGLYLSALDTADLAASFTNAPLWASGPEAFDSGGGARRTFTQQSVKTNTSAQIRSRVSASDGNVTIRIATTGWTDTRGRDA